MLRRSALFATAALAAAALALTACTGSTPDPTPTGEIDPDATLVVGIPLEPTNLDIRVTTGAALEQLLIDNIYQGLVTRDAENAVVPALASEWDVAEDGLTYTFTLQEGVTFHDGAAMTSADVVDSLTTAKDDETIQGHGDLAAVETITAPDAQTVVLTLSEPDINLLFNLTGRGGLVFKTGDTTDRKTAENGTGPFTLGQWRQGDSITLERYADYWGEPAGVAEVVVNYIPDFSAGVNAALDGSLDVLTAVDPNLSSRLDDVNGFTLVRGETTDKGTLAFNQSQPPLDDVRVREALRLAVDREALTTTQGSSAPLYGPIPELDPGYEDLSDVVDFDIERAKELLAEADAEDLELTLTIPSVYGSTIPTFLVSAYDAIGVTLAVKSVDFPTWLTDVYTNKDYDLSFVLHVESHDFGNFANPEYYFTYDNPEVQSLYADALATTDQEESAALLAEAARIVSEDHAADWLYIAQTITAIGPGVSGFPVNSINVRLNLADVTVSGE